MRQYRYSGNIKAGLFLLGLLLVSGLMFYTQTLVKSLREDNREIVKLYAELMAKAVINESDENLNFIFENIIKKVQFPIIQSDRDENPQSWRNLPRRMKTPKQVRRFMKTMDAQNIPIVLSFRPSAGEEPIVYGMLHYGDSILIRKLMWLPYFEIGAMAVFIFLGFIGFTFIRNSEKRHIWVGMARETAHQLGTPVSALMGWINWLKTHPEKSEEIAGEMETDLFRLEQINERFSKMGSEPELSDIDVSELMDMVFQYLQKRLPTTRKNLELEHKIDKGLQIKANGILLSWAIENIVKNGIDAIQEETGKITATVQKQPHKVSIKIRDTGSGIPKKNWKNIFRPGFSTKKRGWGLGLSLTHRIINEIHQGQVSVIDSSELGTTFEIILPMTK
ncbi:MAG: HAMP domain-containing histidine kinase [Candidatus Marinimicrobia bacterium]|nr:HAMP domain-containing histidine kinase [Candidatus Neomarinimicrobiota bacterium]